ncbi:hypothetical protein KTU01_03980 [Kocuria turfanensis]|uniref:Uncharacterized protein n=1 Tax=Kocuria turfanensis TaxID=388357 RepID=A0A512I994_9MICC|nr:hypothetical protein KTU01_03980 [Kocuria turfanensis]
MLLVHAASLETTADTVAAVRLAAQDTRPTPLLGAGTTCTDVLVQPVVGHRPVPARPYRRHAAQEVGSTTSGTAPGTVRTAGDGRYAGSGR